MSNTNHPINGLMDSSMQNLRSLIDANTVVGQPINTPDGTVIIPISRVSFGFASGGSDIPTAKQNEPFGGGAGGGVSVHPVAFLVVSGGKVDLLQINDTKNTADRMVGMVPELIDKIAALIKDKDKKADDSQDEDAIPF